MRDELLGIFKGLRIRNIDIGGMRERALGLT